MTEMQRCNDVVAALRAERDKLQELLKRVVEWKDTYSAYYATGGGLGTLAKIMRDIRKELEERQ